MPALPTTTPLPVDLTAPRASRKARAITALALSASLVALQAQAPARAETPAQLLANYQQQSGTTPSEQRGQQFFTEKHGGDWSCSSCHGNPPVSEGKHAVTGKRIAPMAPSVHAERFSDPAKVEKWFKRNCGDVVNRACTPAEKADVLAWLISLKP